MSDVISRQAAIRWVKTECNPYGKPTLEFESGKRVIEHLENMPPAQPEPHWIPVTERLPEKSGRYFVTERTYHINDKEHTGGFILKTDFAEYSATEKKWRRARTLVVVAWMDNEPYKPTVPPECEGDCGWCKPSVIEKCKGVTT